MNPPDSGLASDMYHVFRRSYHEQKRHGERSDTLLALMGGALVWIGATMTMNAMARMREGRGR